MSSGIIVARYTYPVIELAPMVVTFDGTVEEMVAGASSGHHRRPHGHHRHGRPGAHPPAPGAAG